ncbi:hypothetical protein [Marinobacter salsuginis]|jgi:hypothetical protein|uniref:Uncharacterized protein n=1 Tax=Marinobacter salsuginis TaxID=418719 RepID=A0A5M3Q0D2_9GAMM|nr:hypothetical protein [Marinobacter salsuginis]GBO88643.1 hypothetical protein MSSD14B_23110 [Marinobacter salsuginis]
MSTLTKVFVIGSMSSVGLIVGGIIGLVQGINPELNAWLQILIGAFALTGILAIIGGSALHKKRMTVKSRDDT